MKKEPNVNLVLRLPAGLHGALKDLAAREERSLNNLIIRLLRESVTRRDAPSEDH
jgi:predicted HicB family RNase H-like nuclease